MCTIVERNHSRGLARVARGRRGDLASSPEEGDGELASSPEEGERELASSPLPIARRLVELVPHLSTHECSPGEERGMDAETRPRGHPNGQVGLTQAFRPVEY
jgi:hypothetical protein